MCAKRIRVGVLFGGRSGEHEVSIASAQSVLRALDPEKYEAIPIGIAKDGRWLVGDGAQKLLPQVLKRGHRVILPPDPSAGSLMAVGESLAGPPARIDVMFPVLHGTFGEDGTVQGLLELAGVPYVGGGVLASAVGMDKDVQKRLFHEARIPVVEFIAVSRAEWQRDPEALKKAVARKFRYPVFVKPATLGSSVGMTKVHRPADLPPAMDEAAQFARKILIERAVNAREIEVAVLGNEQPETALPGEIIPHREFYDYAAKYLEGGTELRIPAKLDAAQVKQFQDYARRAFLAIECRGMARVDFFLEKRTGKIYLNELNTIPGFTSISMYPKMWEASGVSYSRLIDRLIELALEEQQEKARTKYAIELPEGAGGALSGGQ
ncbi:MAG TPA: D-alanine--D-alanine ligase family protein [Candidatus Acidoferrales bacterium]|nr:D-alanine--D-alanine ligase family protein [Candidatus Acidoferrales bacterium]